MPVLHRLLADRLADGALRGRKLAVVVHLEAKTACLVLALREAGAEVVAAGSNPLSTQDAVCAALVERGVEVHARHGVSADEFTADLLAVAATGPELVIDDGLELTRRMAEHEPDLYARLRGVSEETTTGVARLRALAADGKLSFPAIAANDARCKHMFDNPYGTGQTTLTAILALTNVLAAGREFCVVGYGWVGKGVARAADGLGGRVTVVEIDPVRALTAHMDGFRVAPLARALPDADVVVTATGLIEAVPATALRSAEGRRRARERGSPRPRDRRRGARACCRRDDRRAPGRPYLRHGRQARARARRRRAREHRGARRQPGRDHGSLVLGAGALSAPARFRAARRRG